MNDTEGINDVYVTENRDITDHPWPYMREMFQIGVLQGASMFHADTVCPLLPRYKPLRYRLGCAWLLWMLILGFCVIISMVPHSIWFSFLLIFYIFLFAAMLFCCVAVLRALKRAGPGEGQKEGSSNMKKRAFKIILIVMLSVVCCYLPSVLTIALRGVLSSNVFYLCVSVCFSVTMITGFLQPLMYLHRNGMLPCIKGLN